VGHGLASPFYLFIVLTLTGVLLMFYYHPSKVQASATSFISNTMCLRQIVAQHASLGRPTDGHRRRAPHVPCFSHRLVQKPREFNWNVGVILLVLTLLLSFTGYLLPDDQLGFWAVTVGTNMARATPLLGHEGPFGSMLGMTPYNDVRFGLLGGSIVDANALLRSYIWHCIGIPIIASIFMVLHFWRVRKGWRHLRPRPRGSRLRSEGGEEVAMDWKQLWEILSAADNVRSLP